MLLQDRTSRTYFVAETNSLVPRSQNFSKAVKSLLIGSAKTWRGLLPDQNKNK